MGAFELLKQIPPVQRKYPSNMARGKRTTASSKKPVEEEEEPMEEVESTNGDAEEDEEELEEIELSSDEEDDDADVALVVMKRPPQTQRAVDMLELGDEDEGPEVEGVEKGSVNIKERMGLTHFTTWSWPWRPSCKRRSTSSRKSWARPRARSSTTTRTQRPSLTARRP